MSLRPSGLLAVEVIVEVAPIGTLEGLAEQEMTGGRGSLTVNLALHDADPFFLPSLKLAVTT